MEHRQNVYIRAHIPHLLPSLFLFFSFSCPPVPHPPAPSPRAMGWQERWVGARGVGCGGVGQWREGGGGGH